MSFDAHKNLAISSVAIAPSPALSGTTLSVPTGEGVRFPAPPFNATVWPKEMPSPLNAEIVRVTAIVGDELTIIRTQEGTQTRAIVVGDLIVSTVTAKLLQDIESGQHFPSISVAGSIVAGSYVQAGLGEVRLVGDGAKTASVRLVTPDGGDDCVLHLTGGGLGANGDMRGAYINLFGNEFPTWGGTLQLAGGTGPGPGKIELKTNSATRAVVHPSGGISVGDAVDPGNNNLSVVGNVKAANLKWRQGYTWSLLGDVSALGFLPGMCLPLVGTQTAKIVGARGRIHSGTSIMVNFYLDDQPKGSVALNASRNTTAFDIPILNEQELLLQLHTPVGTPTNFSLTFFVEYTI